jgi:hypothetical protein
MNMELSVFGELVSAGGLILSQSKASSATAHPNTSDCGGVTTIQFQRGWRYYPIKSVGLDYEFDGQICSGGGWGFGEKEARY